MPSVIIKEKILLFIYYPFGNTLHLDNDILIIDIQGFLLCGPLVVRCKKLWMYMGGSVLPGDLVGVNFRTPCSKVRTNLFITHDKAEAKPIA